MHIGDPEFYRGSSCNFWPIYQGKLHHLSATIHRIDQNIDTGDILSKQAVILSEKDNEQTLFLKPIILGTKLMINTIKKWQSESLQSIPLNRSGKLYKKADFNPKVLLELKQNEYYRKPSEIRRERKAKARLRQKKFIET